MAQWKRPPGGIDAFKSRLERAIYAGLTAQANALRNAWKRNLRGGFTSGDFVTGRAINSIRIAGPERQGAGFMVRVGTDVKYVLFWEVGHLNLFSRRYEHVPTLAPALEESLEVMRQRFRAAFTRALAGSPITPDGDTEPGLSGTAG